jgi:hypothetical protein
VQVATRLATPPVACLVPHASELGGPDPVFDAFGWCESDWLDWRRPDPSQGTSPDAPANTRAWDETTPLDGSDPRRMVFVLRRACDFLPGELARLHAFGLGLTDEVALAPWGIDAATDELYAHRVRPRDLLWLAADNLNALFWGLHDWAHFHNHGPFEERAWTELQCDASALAWLWKNRVTIGLGREVWERLRGDVVVLTRQRFAAEGRDFDERRLAAGRIRALVEPGG